MTSVTGLGRLVRFIVRRDRRRLAIWIVAVSGMTLASAATLPSVYPDERAVESYVRLFGNNPSLVAFAGPGYGFDDPNIGIILVNETQLNGMIALALMSIFLVNRHTRAEEESERAELVRSNVVGRHAPTAAATLVIGGANLVVGLVCAAGFVALDYQVSGSLALAASLACVGLVFAGIAAVAAQLTSSGRATLGLASGALAASFVIRAIGDIADNGLSWLSPIGIAQAVRAYADERWWALALSLVVAAGSLAVAFWLSTRRDLGSGLLPPRAGRAAAPAWMTTPLGLAFRLQRAALAGWTVNVFVLAYLYGSVALDIEEMIEENPVVADFFAQTSGASITDAFFAQSMLQLGITTAAFAIASALRLASEEAAGRAEPILATPTGRWRWSLSHLVVAFSGTVVIMAVAGLGVGISYASIAGDWARVPELLGAALVTIPAILVMAGVAVAFFGASPASARAGWGAFAVVVALSLFGELLSLPEVVRQASPFQHLPALPAEDLALLPVAGLTMLAAALTAAGLWAFRARDLRAG